MNRSDITDELIKYTHIWTPRLLQAKFSKIDVKTEIKIAAIYPVSQQRLYCLRTPDESIRAPIPQPS
jgi:hypothetical protein